VEPEFREYRAEDADAVRDLLNVVFAKAWMTPESWAQWTAEDWTAPVALVDGRIAGAIPLHRRAYRVAPGAEVVAWVEHRVGVAEELRDRGLGSGMHSSAKEFLQGRGDVLLVHRGHERSDGYRFYDRNGLHDVSYLFTVTLEPTDAAGDGVRWLDADAFLAREAEWLALFEDCYAGFGGFPARRPGTQRRVCTQGIWDTAIRTDLAFAVLEEAGQPAGYAIVGQREPSWNDPAVSLMEIAVRDASVERMARLLGAARARGRPLRCRVSTAAPLAQAIRQLGVELPPRERSSMTMVHVLDIGSAGRKVWRDVPELRDVEVRVWTPSREGVLHAPACPTRSVAFELKEPMLSRLLCRRLDVAAAVAEERITLCGARPGDAEALARALPPCPWVYHQIDYL